MSVKPGRIVYRDMRIDSARGRWPQCGAALSSELEVPRAWGVEILAHTPDAIDMSRAADGLPLLWNHDSDRMIGAVSNIRLDEDRVLRGTLTLSRNTHGSEVLQDIHDGLLKTVSIGYRIDDYTESTDGRVLVTRWTPVEISMAPVPADASVGINRSISQEDSVMDPEVKTPATPVATPARSSTWILFVATSTSPVLTLHRWPFVLSVSG
jgi:Caudovirus prohead protease.